MFIYTVKYLHPTPIEFLKHISEYVIFAVFTVVTRNNAVFWDVTSSGFCNNDVLKELSASIIKEKRHFELGTNLAVAND
jgi:hypothetical protein